MLLGINEATAPKDLAAKYPGAKLTRNFVGGVLQPGTDILTKVKSACKATWDAGLIPVVSFKTDPVKTAQGAYDTELRAVATFLKTAPQTWVVWYHEPEDDMTGPQFKAAFDHVRNLFKEVAPIVSFGYSAMAYQWGNKFHPGGEPHTVDPTPWLVNADFYACDVYSGDSNSVDTLLDTHIGYQRWRKQAIPPNACFGLTERGWAGDHTDAQRAKAIADEAPLYVSGGLNFVIYWNTPGTQNDPKLLMGPLATEAVKSVIWAYSQPGPEPVPQPDPLKKLQDDVNDLKARLKLAENFITSVRNL